MIDEVLPFFVVAVHYDHKEKEKEGKWQQRREIDCIPKGFAGKLAVCV